MITQARSFMSFKKTSFDQYQNNFIIMHHQLPHTEIVPGGVAGGQAESLPLRPHRPLHGKGSGAGAMQFLKCASFRQNI